MWGEGAHTTYVKLFALSSYHKFLFIYTILLLSRIFLIGLLHSSSAVSFKIVYNYDILTAGMS